MAGSILNREDYKSAIPQLSAKLNEILDNNIVINRTVVNLTEGKVSDLNSYLGYFQSLTTGYFQAIAGDVQFLSSRQAYLGQLKADIAGFGYLTAETADLRYATIQSLTAATARIGDLEADHVSVSDITATNARVGDLEADHVSVSDLNATNADVSHLKVGDLTIGGVTVNIYDLAMAIKSDAMASGTTWYKVSATTPSAPTGFDPTAEGWSQTEPAYVAGTTNHLYSCLRVVYADDDPQGTRSYQWSDVHLIQSWEAAKSAYTYADDANTAATTAKSAADSAMKGLGQVEDVVGVLEWITNHGTMESQAGETFDENNVYFIVDPNGDYVIGSTHYSLVTNPVAADIDSYYCLSVDRSIQNYVATHIVVDSEGLWIIPDSGGNKVLIATGGAGKTYETAGTYMIGKDSNEDDVILASFSLDGTHVQSVTGELIAHLGYGQAYDDEGALQNQPFFTLGRRNNGGVGGYSFAFGVDVVASGFCSHAEGNMSYAQGMYSYAHGKVGIFRESQGAVRATQATGESSHAEGSGVIASGMASHAEGEGCEATASGSHAEGSFSVASGMASHAEGEWCDATGMYSHAQNLYTEAEYEAQTAIGKYNDNQSDNAFEIGNGTDDNNRSNAFEVDWDGRVNCGDNQGTLTALLDLIHPVGSYYWTSDGDFLPEDVFGGRWEKIDAGVTLVSAGTGYTVTSGTAKDGGSEDSIIPYHRHSVAEQNTGNMSANSSHSHTVGYVNYKRASTTAATTAVSYAETTANKTTSSESVQHTHKVPSHNTNYAGTSGNTTGANMPPYKCAYCWHRTA